MNLCARVESQLRNIFPLLDPLALMFLLLPGVL